MKTIILLMMAVTGTSPIVLGNTLPPTPENTLPPTVEITRAGF